MAEDDAGAQHETTTRILIVEDAPEVAQIVRATLSEEGFEVQVARDGESAIELARAEPPDLVLLDIGLPGIDGIEVCRRLRTFSDAYLVMLTARDSEFDRVLGLSMGADDYITKPFSPRELIARIRAMQRRPRASAQSPTPDGLVLRFGELVLDTATREVRVGERMVELSRLEYELLRVLAQHPRQALSREQLLEQVWGDNWFGDDHVLDVHISNLRRKLGDDPRRPRFVRTVRGYGFRLHGS
jgi:DNA-binding response OmpR family regulator